MSTVKPPEGTNWSVLGGLDGFLFTMLYYIHISIDTVDEEIKLVRCRYVYKCRICRIYIPKKMHRLHFGL